MKKNYIQIISITVALFASACFLSSCASQQKEIPADMTALEIIQQAQNAYDSGNIKLAEHDYQVLLQRFGNDTATYVEGRYEIAHIYLKQKKYYEASAMYQEIISIYENSIPGQLPGAYRKLAENDLATIPADKRAPVVTTTDSTTPPEALEK